MARPFEGLTDKLGITRLATLTGLDRVGYPVVAAIRPMSRNLTVSMGKGATVERAQLSAIMEAAELHFSERPHVPLVDVQFSHMEPGSALDPSLLDDSESDPGLLDRTLEWLKGKDVQTGRDIWVPWQAISMDYSAKVESSTRVASTGGTGLAAALSHDEAVLHGLYEVIERDNHATWNALCDQDRLATLVDPSSVSSESVQAMRDSIAEAELHVWIWDMTGKSRIPSYLVEVLDYASGAPVPFAQGAATHSCAGVAVEKAMAEALQVRLTYISGSRDDLEWSDYGDRYDSVVKSRRWLQQVPLLYRGFEEDGDAGDGNATVALAGLCQRLQQLDCRSVIVVPLSPVDCSVSAVKVIVPSLRDTPDANYYENQRRQNRGN
jgi:YcaO-like protein with predicted kinase domain